MSPRAAMPARTRSSRSRARSICRRRNGRAPGRRGCAARDSVSRSARMPAGGAEIPTFLSYWIEKRLSKQAGGVRHHRRDRRRRRAGGRQQRLRGRRAGADAHARPADLGHRRDHPLGVPELRHQARAAPVPEPGRAGMGADREPLHRQRHAARAQPAAGRAVGEGAAHSGAADVCRHPGVRDHRLLRHLQLAGRPDPALHHRRDRLPDAALRFPDRAGDHRHDPGSARRDRVPARHDDLRRRLVDLLHPSAVGDAARSRRIRRWSGRGSTGFTRTSARRGEAVPGDA